MGAISIGINMKYFGATEVSWLFILDIYIDIKDKMI